ncbi:MAG: GTPase domain-containing protein [Deltaproteobacteria bacterium]|nr:GTPase domain-containing protein [Deltaproteobacteria bacterium]
MQIDFEQKEIQLKVVYYGPALSGKTTNLVCIHRLCAPSNRGRLMTLETRDDRTLFFDLLPLHFESESGLSITVKVFTVPGQVIHNATRRLVLQGADSVAFIADSQTSQIEANQASFLNLKENLKQNGLNLKTMPLVIQFNKRDLPGIRTDAEIELMAKKGKEPVFKAVATQGTGIIETFMGLMKITWERLDTWHDLTGKFGVRGDMLLESLRRQLTQPVE